MKTCPYCAEDIPSSATVCPECNMQLRRKRSGGKAARRPQPQSSNAGLWILILGGVFVAGVAVIGILAALLLPAVQQARTAARISQSKNHLKMIGLALHNYHDTHNTFPPGGIFDADGRMYHGWQTSLLPYVDQSPLYNMIDFHVPWDDPRNAGLFQAKVPVYLNANIPETENVEGYALSHYAGNSHLFGENSTMRIQEIKDGTANTILAGEVSVNLVPWGIPTNYRDPASGINTGPNTFGGTSYGTNFLMTDGSVRTIHADVDPQLLKALSTPSGGEPAHW